MWPFKLSFWTVQTVLASDANPTCDAMSRVCMPKKNECAAAKLTNLNFGRTAAAMAGHKP